MDPNTETPKCGTVLPNGHWWLGCDPKPGCDGPRIDHPHIVIWRSAIHQDSLSGLRGWSVGHKRGPPIVSIHGSPRLRRDLLCFGSSFGEPVTGPHVGHSWRLALAFGFIGGDALRLEARWLLLIPEYCPGGQRQKLTVNNSTLLV